MTRELWVSMHISGQAPLGGWSLLGGLWGSGSREQSLQVQTTPTQEQLQEPSSGVESGWKGGTTNITPPTTENTTGDQPRGPASQVKKSRSASSKHRTEAGKEAQPEKHS